MAARGKAASAPRKRPAAPARAAAPRPAPRAPSKARRTRRLAVAYDIDGPRIRLGLLWFVVELACLAGGVVPFAALFALTAGVAALQTARALRLAGEHPNRVGAGLCALVVVAAGAVTTGMVGVALIGGAAASVFLASGPAAVRRRNLYDDAGATVRCWLFVGLAAASVVTCARFSLGGALVLLVLAGAYESGDYVIGSGAANPYEGPAAGVASVLVVTFAITAVNVKPFVFPDSFALGAMAAVLCPLGQLAGSLVLPRFDAPAAALRRLDSLLLLAPAWAVAVGILVK